MGRPLRAEWIKDLSIHTKDGQTVNPVKQVGYNKFKTSDGKIIRLVAKEETLTDETGYVVVSHGNEELSLFKLTKHQVHCIDANGKSKIFSFNPELEMEEGKVIGIKLPADSAIEIEDIAKGSEPEPEVTAYDGGGASTVFTDTLDGGQATE